MSAFGAANVDAIFGALGSARSGARGLRLDGIDLSPGAW